MTFNKRQALVLEWWKLWSRTTACATTVAQDFPTIHALIQELEAEHQLQFLYSTGAWMPLASAS